MQNHTAYRLALGLAFTAALLIVWLNVAAGMIGIEDDDPANLLYVAVLAVGFVGAIVARFQPVGLARAAFVTAGALAVVAAVALALPNTAGPAQIVIVHGGLVAMFAGAGWWFRWAARAHEGRRPTMTCLTLALLVAMAGGSLAQAGTMKENPYYSRADTTKLDVPDATWKKILPADVYAVAREKDTERAFTGTYWDFEGIGTYFCAVCGNNLFRSDSKFASSCGWPSFFEAARPGAVTYEDDTSYGMNRIEVLCGRCGSHLGHLFDDGPPPTGKRYCMNSIVLEFEPDGTVGR